MIKADGHVLNIERHFYMGELEETYFEVKKPCGNYCHLDWSGWGGKPTQNDFSLWIQLGYPTRDHPAIKEYKAKKGWNTNVSEPLNTEYLQAIKEYEGQ